MIKEQVKCPRCEKVLLRLYSNAVREITCACGFTMSMKKYNAGEYDAPAKGGKKYAYR